MSPGTGWLVKTFFIAHNAADCCYKL